jgi:hypothetical protein
MSLRIDIHVPFFSPPPGISGTILYTIFDSSVSPGSLHDVIAVDIPSLMSQIEENLAEFTCGDIKLTCRNDDGGWDSVGFNSATCDPTARYPVCLYVDIYQDGVLVFQGDVDLKTISFDRKQRTVSFTILGPLHRLEQWNAEVVKRQVPNLSDTGIVNSATSLGGGQYAIECSPKTWYVNPATARCEVQDHCLIDSSGVIWTVVSGYGVAINNRVSRLKLGTAVNPPGPNWGKTASAPPATGSFAIRPMIFASRYDWQSDPTVYTLSHTPTSLTDPGKNWLTNVFAGYWLEDSAKVFWQITSNTGTVLTVTAQGAYPSGPDITAHTWPGTIINAPSYNIRKSNTYRLLESLGPSVVTLGLTEQTSSQPGDQLNITTAGNGSQIASIAAFTTLTASTQQDEIEFAGAHSLPPLSASVPNVDHMLWMMDDVQNDLLPTDGVTLATPYYRGQTVSWLANALIASCASGALTPNVVVQAFSNNAVPYADFSQKSVADALTELATVSNCTVFCSFSGPPTSPLVTYNFMRRDPLPGNIFDLSGYTSDGVTPKVTERQDSVAWEWWYPQISVRGANKTQVQKGSLRYGATNLNIQSDFMDSYSWLHQVLDRLWTYFGSRRAKTTLKVKGEYAIGIQLFSQVSLTGSDLWWVIKLNRPLRSPIDQVELDVVSATGVMYTPTDYSTLDPSVIPEPPGVSVTGTAGLHPKTAALTWSFPVQGLLGFNRRLWGVGSSLQGGVGERPKDPNFFAGVGGKLTVTGTGTFADTISVLDLQVVMYPSPWYVEYEAVLVDGRTSLPSGAVSFS